MNNMFVPFRPSLEGEFRRRFYDKARQIYPKLTAEAFEAIVSEEVQWAELDCRGGNLNQRRRYRATWMFLRDLFRAGWRVEFHNGVLEMRLPRLSKEEEKHEGSLMLKKEQLRRWMADSRAERLAEHTEFVHRIGNLSRIAQIRRELIRFGG
jgi:hypothetical protein